MDSADLVRLLSPVPAAHAWPTNGHLIEDVARLGYLSGSRGVLDPTYGHGVFWSRWRPHFLVGTDLDKTKSLTGRSVDFRALPHPDATFDAVVFDPPYKLNGTPDEATDERYGVHLPTRWQDRMELILDGATECARVLRKGGHLLVKCQDQVCSGKIRWQTKEITEHLEEFGGLELVDRFDMLGTSRPQPAGRTQRHAHGRPSTLLVFRK